MRVDRARFFTVLCVCTGTILGWSPWALSSEPITLGALFISSGPMGGYGKHGKQAIELAVEEINSRGGIAGRKLEAFVEDTQLKKDVATEIATRFISEKRVDFLMGPTSSGIAMALTEIAREAKKPLILTQAAADELTGANFHPYVFSTLSNAMMHSRSGAYFLASKPYKRYLCLAPNYSYGHSSWKVFKAKLKEIRPDVEIVGELFPKFLSADYSSEIQKILEVKPDAVWCPLWGGDAIKFIEQALPSGLFEKVAFAFPVAGALEVLVPLGKKMPEGVYVSSRYFFNSPNSSLNNRFVEAYRKRFNEYPDYMAGETYAGVYFLKAAVERAGSTDPDEIVRAVEREPLAWETPEGWKVMRGEDHQAVEDCLWGETHFNEMYGFAIPETFISIQGEQIGRTAEELEAVRSGR